MGERDGKILLFAADTGLAAGNWQVDPYFGTYFGEIVYSPDGKTLAEVHDKVIQMRDAQTGKPKVVRPGLHNFPLAARFAADSKTVTISTWGGGAAMFDALTGKEKAALSGPPPDFAGRDERTPSTALSADGAKAALVDKKGVLHVWETATGKSICRIHEPPVGHDQAELSPDGKIVVVKHQDYVTRLWDASTGKLLHALPLKKELRGQTGRLFPHPHAISRDGRLLANAPQSDQDSIIRIWETATAKEWRKLPLTDGTYSSCLVFSPDRRYLITAHEQSGGGLGKSVVPGPDAISVRVWDLASGKESHRMKVANDVRSMAISPDGKTLAAALYDSIQLWELVSGKERGRFAGHLQYIWTMDFSPDGRLLVSGGFDYTALVWDLTGMNPSGQRIARRLQKSEAERLWADLADADGTRAYRAIWALAAAADDAVAFLAERLKPVPAADAERLSRLILQLDSSVFSERQQATRELEKLHDLAEGALRKALAAKPTIESQRRLEGLLAKLNGPISEPETLRTLRAIEVLEKIGTPAARRVLQTMAAGAESSRLTRESKLSLERLARS
jgi:WD40 repeat protein